MSHTVYSTDAIVLGRVGTGEADVTLWLLTRELGLIVAKAQSARKEEAKMRSYLQMFGYLRASLVRGKHVWRVTGTEQIDKDSGKILCGQALSSFANIANFVRRMTVSDTQSMSELFDIVLITKHELINNNKTAELEAMAKILVSLGYLNTKILSEIDNANISQDALAIDVNKAIVESQM